MNTVEKVAAMLAAGKRPSALWATEDCRIELRFASGEVVDLDYAALDEGEKGSRRYNAAIGDLSKIAVTCGWETDPYEAKKYISQQHIVAGYPTQIYPFNL